MDDEFQQVRPEDIFTPSREDGQGTQPVQPSFPGSNIDVEDVTTPKPIVQPPQQKSTPNDILKSIASQSALGATADVASLPSLPRTVFEAIGEKTGLMPNEEERIKQQMWVDQQIAKQREAYEGSLAQKYLPTFLQPKFDQKGDEIEKAYRRRYPTSEQIEKQLSGTMDLFGYVPKGEEARKAGELARAGASMWPGPLGPVALAGRMAAGALGRYAGQQAGELQKRTGFLEKQYEPYLEPLVSLVGTMGAIGFGNIAKSLSAPTKVGEEAFASAMAEDIRLNRVRPDVFQRALESGTPISAADIFGPGTETRKLIEKSAGIAGKRGNDIVDAFNATISRSSGEGVSPRIPAAQDRMARFIGPRDAPASESMTKAANDIIRTSIYNLVKREPSAQAITLEQIGPELSNNKLIKDAINEVISATPTAPKEFGIVAPKNTPASPARPYLSVDGKPMLDASGSPIMKPEIPGVQTPGNLAFYDMVKRNLDDKIKSAERPTATSYDQLNIQSLKDARAKLVDKLDDIVKEYGPTRARAGELYGMDGAPRAGSEYYRTRMNIFDKNGEIQKFQNLSPEAKALFREGWLHELSRDLGTQNGIQSVSNKMQANSEFIKNAKIILGKDFDIVRGKISAENLGLIAKEIKPVQPPKRSVEIFKSGVKGALPAAGVAMMETLTNAAMQAQFLSPDKLALFLAGAAAGATKSAGQQLLASRVANRVIPLAFSNKSEDLIRLSKLIDTDPNAARMVRNLNAAAQMLQQKTAKTDNFESQQERPQRATGGRIVNLKSLARSAKKAVCNSTEDLLKTPDEHVVKALEIANRSI